MKSKERSNLRSAGAAMDCRAATVGRGTGFVAGTRAIAGLAALACGLVPAPSRADGAFPDSQTILVPAAHPDEVILVTNFGLILTEDGGTTWNWSCEGTANAFGTFYQQSPPPRRRMLV